MPELGFMDQLAHLTTRIVATNAAGESSLGTGFFYAFEVPEKGQFPIVVTNKHVLEGATVATINVSIGDGAGNPSYGRYYPCNIMDIADVAIGHSDPAIDLVAFPVAALFSHMADQGHEPFFRQFGAHNIPNEDVVENLIAVEDVIMVGYPTGLWDSKHNVPIMRRGITATPYHFDYEGRPEFMIDAACFPGSSGSPVVIANSGGYTTKGGNTVFGQSRILLLGVLWGGPQFTAEGTIEVKPVPTKSVPISKSPIPTNLGWCIKSRIIRDLEPLLLARFG